MGDPRPNRTKKRLREKSLNNSIERLQLASFFLSPIDIRKYGSIEPSTKSFLNRSSSPVPFNE
uniref:Uncharacterized protein n=1 Tax=Utricularia reniformis TaxID=192314 RepID=A0A1Y0AZA4_9LAMI|nr:hypothetical protein AEK19_MT0194 [Utricularia reniformis]ART30474.1 hypothetical protein AEK19_MT0194 [Utricularia reniformis]